jgi:hypothetical protein
MRHVFLVEQLGDFAIGPNRDRLPRRQLDGSFVHPPTVWWTLVRQQSPQGIGNQISKRRAALYCGDFGTLHKIIRKVKRSPHKYMNMLLRVYSAAPGSAGQPKAGWRA